MGFEGIVSKRVGGIYWSGRCRNWIEGEEPRVFQRPSGIPYKIPSSTLMLR